jgi:hypothetical protein
MMPPGVDLEHPSVARVYDYFLGGTANWAIDREFGKKVLTRMPVLRPIAKANRLFLHRAVRYLVRQGVRQFVDIGSGIPTMGNTHEVAEDLAPGAAHVVYVDNEPVAVAHSEMLLDQHGDRSRHAVINADLREPDRLWEQVRQTGVIDVEQPVAVLIVAVLHFHQPGPDGTDVGAESVARYRELLVPGSYLAISLATADGVGPVMAERLRELDRMYQQSGSTTGQFRSQEQIRDLFGDFTIVEPGLTWTPLWHPEETGSIAPVISFEAPNESAILAGVGRKPQPGRKS